MTGPAALPTMPKRIAEIIATVAQQCGVTPEDILGRSRVAGVASARFEAIRAVSACSPSASTTMLARWFNRDHSTILATLGRVTSKPRACEKADARRLRDQVAAYLRDYLPGGWVVKTEPLMSCEGRRGWPTVAVYGEKPGLVPSVWFLCTTGLRRPPNDEERATHDQLRHLGFEVESIRSTDELREMLSVWDLPCRQDAHSAAA